MQINLFPDLSLFAVMAIFVLNYLVVRKFFLEPINRVMEEREHDTKSADEVYEQAMARFNEATANVEERLHIAKREAANVRETFRAEASAHRATMIEKTRGEAEKFLTEADTKLKDDVTTARDRIVSESDALAQMAAERILGRAV
ncbi:MAG TPA: ATP synthase F0 subunit B [Thermoanaerobaculia bacterium]|jgi:F0F1-type ATP synthase membrane subunit b/b'|nr:ATP synthase F0 subunit B [Thermoanaerobaculia bacterium]